MSKRARCIVDSPSIALNDGTSHPQLGYGTYKVGFVPASASGSGGVATGAGGDAKGTVLAALELGYRFLDCAEFYGNEAAVGEAIAASGVPRAELFLASKVWSDTLYAGRSAIREQVGKSLADLQTDYLDLYLVHWPVPGKHVLAYKHLEELRAEGKIRSIGVSNYTIEDYQELMEHATVPPAINQIEVNPFLYRKKTIDFFQAQGVAIQAYRSLFAGQGKKALSEPVVTAVASEHGKSPAQVLGRWCVQKGLIYLPKSEKEERMIENTTVFDFELTAENMAALDALTSQDSIDAFAALYKKCVVRDTPIEATGEGVKAEVTCD